MADKIPVYGKGGAEESSDRLDTAATDTGSNASKKPRPRRGGGPTQELQTRLQNALIEHAQQDAMRDREKKVAEERDRNIENRNLASQAQQCSEALSAWDSRECRVVYNYPTTKELQEHTKSYEGIVSAEGRVDPESMIVSAIRSGNVEVLEHVCKMYGPGLAMRDVPNFNTPIHFAASQRNGLDMVKKLLDLGHDATTPNRYSWSATDFARQLDNKAVMETLDFKPGSEKFAADVGKEGTSNDVRQKEEDMMIAVVRLQQGDLADFLISRVRGIGGAVDKTNGNTVLHYAVLLEDDESMCMSLLNANADTMVRNKQGRTALNMAESKQRTKCMLLLKRWEIADDEERTTMLRNALGVAADASPGETPRDLSVPPPEEAPETDRSDRPSESGRAALLGLEASPKDARRELDPRTLDPDNPRPSSRGGDDGAWLKNDISDLLDNPLGTVDEHIDGAHMLAGALKEIASLRNKIEKLERQQEESPTSPEGKAGAAGGRAKTPQQHQIQSRPGTGDAVGAAAIEELFYKLHLMQAKIDKHEVQTASHSQTVTEQQEKALFLINSKMQEITLQQQQAASILAETSSQIGSFLRFDQHGRPAQMGKIIVTVQSAHGLLHLDPALPPSPYVIISLDQQIEMTAVAPHTRNPIWEKECVFDVPDKECKLVLSVLDRSIMGPAKTVLLGKAALALDVVPNHDVQDWYDLSTDEFGTIKQHAGSIRVRRLFVPLAKWGEFERDRMARGGAPRDEGRVGKDQVGDKASRKDASTPIPPADKQVIAGLYMAVLSGTGLAAPGQPQSKATANVKFDLGDHVGETNAKSYKSSLVWGDEADEFFMPTVDMRQKLRLYLTVHQEGNTERAAFMALNVSGFPFGEVYEDWHEMDINAGFYNLDPRVRLAFYRTHPLDNVPDKSVTCVYCGRDLPSQFQAAHLSVACSKFAIDCPHARVGCTWHGPRLGLENHVVKCPFEKLREAIYATTSEIQGIQGLLSDSAAGDARRNLEVADLNAMSAITPRLFKTYTGHKKPVTCMAGIKSTRQLASADEAGMIKLWSMQGDGELDSFRAHTGEVLCLHFTPEFPSKVFSGGAFPDDTIKIWDNSDFHCERKMLGGGNNFAINDLAALRVTAGQMEDSRLFSVDDSALLRAWDVETGTCIQSTPGHELGIKAVIARDQQIITGSLDMSARIWDVRTLEHVATLDCIGDSVMALDFVQDWVLCAGTNSVKVWDITTRRLYRVLDGCRWPILFQDGLLYCAIHDSAQDIKVFDASHVDPKNWKVLDLLKGHSADVTALEWFNGTLCSASVDKTIKLWRAEP